MTVMIPIEKLEHSSGCKINLTINFDDFRIKFEFVNQYHQHIDGYFLFSLNRTSDKYYELHLWASIANRIISIDRDSARHNKLKVIGIDLYEYD